MRQLDLFGNIIETKPEAKKPHANNVDSIQKKNADREDSFPDDHVKEDLNEDLHAGEIEPNGIEQELLEEDNIQQNSPEDEGFSLASYDIPTFEVDRFETEKENGDTNAEEIIQEDLEIETQEEDNKIAGTEPLQIIELANERELIIEDESSKPLSEDQEDVAAHDKNGSVIFSDGKISVKIKSKTPVASAPAVGKIERLTQLPQKRGRKSFKEIDAELDLIEVPEDEILFQKQYYQISQVAEWFKVNASLIRFWENEFDVLKPKKNRKGDRLFRPEDVKNLQLIYHLLRQKKYTIEGAKEYIKTNKKKADLQMQLTTSLQKFKGFLLDLKANLQ